MSLPTALLIIRHLRNGGDPTLTNRQLGQRIGRSRRSVTDGLSYAYDHGLLDKWTEQLPGGDGTRRHLYLTDAADTALNAREEVTA